MLLPRARSAAERARAQADAGRRRGARAAIRGFLLFLLAVGAIQASHAMFYVFGVLHWRAQGLSAGYIATLWAIARAGRDRAVLGGALGDADRRRCS